MKLKGDWIEIVGFEWDENEEEWAVGDDEWAYRSSDLEQDDVIEGDYLVLDGEDNLWYVQEDWVIYNFSPEDEEEDE